ncbi:MAG: pyridoxal-phosphate dependent enzyme, partial [Alphaproteobacteria bacterium]|nr:pyridoxal-phosphate dependent enzyme [Alphaproteobacteria bacterium]
VRVVGVEPVGAPTLHDSLAAGALVTLERIETEAGTLAPLRSAQLNLELIAAGVDRIVLVDDEAMRKAARWLWFEAGVAAELSGAAALAALMAGAYEPEADERIIAIVCGAGSDGLG